MTHQMPDGGIDHSIAVVDFGASSTTFSVLRNLKVVYTRDFAFGGQQLTEEIMRTYGLSMEEAGRAKKEGGLPGNYQAEVLDPFIDDMTQQVSRSLQFYLASGSGREQPEKILVCGGCANISGVGDVIRAASASPPKSGDPLGQMKLSSRAKRPGGAARCHCAADRLRSCPAEFRLNATYKPTSLARRATQASASSQFFVALGGAAVLAASAAFTRLSAVRLDDRRAGAPQ